MSHLMKELKESPMYNLPVYHGMRIFINDDMTGGYVKRSFKERFFSRPWVPWKTIKFDSNAGELVVPDGQVHRLVDTDKLLMNSRTKRDFERALDENHISTAQNL